MQGLCSESVQSENVLFIRLLVVSAQSSQCFSYKTFLEKHNTSQEKVCEIVCAVCAVRTKSLFSRPSGCTESVHTLCIFTFVIRPLFYVTFCFRHNTLWSGVAKFVKPIYAYANACYFFKSCLFISCLFIL